jgi:hypothetical protein
LVPRNFQLEYLGEFELILKELWVKNKGTSRDLLMKKPEVNNLKLPSLSGARVYVL